MKKIEYRGILMGGRIHALRVAKRMTQEQLAALLCVSPAAVSKWERNLANPCIEMLWAMADHFDCSIDELVGRSVEQVERLGAYDKERLRLAEIAEDLLKCSEVSRAQGLLAMEEQIPQLKSRSRFLSFAISLALHLFMKQMDFEQTFHLLENYAAALPEEERAEGHMIATVLKAIFAGEHTDIIRELTTSHIGMEYREKMESVSEARKRTRDEILEGYKNKKLYSDATNLLEGFGELGDFEIQTILKNLDNHTLTAALTGASGRIVVRFLWNLSDRILYFIHEDMERWSGTEAEILEAQRKVLEVSSFCKKELRER